MTRSTGKTPMVRSNGVECVVVAVIALTALAAVTTAGCAPRVAIEAPTEPITINMNVKIEHEITIRVDKDLDELMLDDELFGEAE
jgi:hypothetical protein